MNVHKGFPRTLSVVFIVISMLSAGMPARANDIVPTSDITGGASVFIFRGSSKKPQSAGASARGYSAGGTSAETTRRRIRGQAVNARVMRQRAARARQAELARIRARERNARIRQSNVLTAKAETLLESDDHDGAITLFREALGLNSANSEAASGLSEALVAKGLTEADETGDESALAYFEEAAKLDPRNEIAFLKMGEIHDAADRTGDAILHFEKALDIDPEISAIYFPLGLAYAITGNDEKAEQYLLKAEAMGASTGESLTTRGLIASRQGRNDEAIILFDRAIAIAPDQGEAYVEKARLLAAVGRGDDAYRTLQQASRSAGGSSAVWFGLGVYAYNRGEYTEAMNAYLKALELAPGNAQAHANLASTYRQMERFADANAQYRAAFESGIDKDADLFSEWGYCLGQTKEWDRAMARLDTARELSPTAIDHNNVGWAYYNAARADKDRNDEAEYRRKLELSRAALQKAVEMDDTLYAAFLNLGATNNGLGDFAAAKEALERALSLQNDWLIAVNQLGLSYRGNNDLQGAINQFARANKINTNDAFSLLNLGELYHLTGNRREARRIADRLKIVDPTLARRLDDVLSGRIVLDEAKRNIRPRVPTIRRIPY